MDRAFLEDLGLKVRDADGVIEAELELNSGQAMNPLTRQFLNRAQFTVVGDRLIAIDPPELVGLPPINVAHLQRASALEDIIVKALNDAIMHVQRRSAELTSLGFSPKVDPASLSLTVELKPGDWEFTIGTDRMGHFRVQRAVHSGSEMTATSAHSFELSEFRERSSLEGYLVAMFEGSVETQKVERNKKTKKNDDRSEVDTEPHSPAAGPPDVPLYFKDLVGAFGPMATIPGRGNIEVLIELRVDRESYRFAAARVSGKTFRGLLAGANGKLWADRFELNEFPGIKQLLAMVLGVPESKVEVIG
jgi:hypothetical protein